MSKPRLLTLHGKTLSVSQWAKQTGLNRVTINKRLESGWSIERALTSPHMKAGRPRKRPESVVFPPFKELQRQHIAIARQLHDALRASLLSIEQQIESQLANYVAANGMPAAQQRELVKGRGVGQNFAKKPKDRTHSTAQETT